MKTPRSPANTRTVRESLDGLAQQIRAGSVVVFCGAGISKHSGLPLVGELLPCILHALNADDIDHEFLTAAKLPFEAFMEVLHTHSRLDPLLDIFTLGEPNTTHLLLAKLAKAGYLRTIVTTNFDRLIETALAREDLLPTRDYSLAYDEDTFRSLDRSASRLQVIKIHGTIDDRAQIAMTLRQVAAKRPSAWRTRAIHRIVGGVTSDSTAGSASSDDRSPTQNVVLILGYSCSDVFDLVPQIQGIREGQKTIVLLQHSDATIVEDIEAQSDRNPFRLFHGQRVHYNTDSLVEFLWRRLVDGDHQLLDSPVAWVQQVHMWSSELDTPVKHLILGALLSRMSQFARAFHHYSSALDTSEATPGRLLRGRIHAAMAENRRVTGEYEEGMYHAREALGIARAHGDQKTEIAALVELGALRHTTGEYDKAIYHYEEARTVTRQLGDRSEEAQMLGRIAVTYRHLGNYESATTHYQRAVTAAREVGDKWAEVTHLANLGVTYREMSDRSKAVDVLTQALVIARDVGDRQGEMICLGNMGNCHADEHRTVDALECYRTVVAIAEAIGDKQALQTALDDLGTEYVHAGETDKGMSHLHRAVEMARSSHDRRGEETAVGHLAMAYGIAGDHAVAIQLYRQALEIAIAIANRPGEGVHLTNLAMEHMLLGQQELARDLLGKALARLNETLGDTHPFTESVRVRLSGLKGDEDFVDPSHRITPLHMASYKGLSSLAARLLREGASPDTQNSKGQTALHVATIEGHTSIVDIS